MMKDPKNNQESAPSSQTDRLLTRRNFLKGAGALTAGAAATAATGALVACSTPAEEPQKAAEQATWDREVEIVVCGYGGSGALSAICAKDAGADVLVVEKQLADTADKINHSPSVRLSASATMNFHSEADAKDYLTAASMGRTPDDVIASWAKYAWQVVPFMKSLGANPIDSGESSTEYPLDLFPQGNNYTLFNYADGGPELWDSIDKAAKERGVEVLFDTPAKKLITNAEGTVIGVVAGQDGKELKIKATKAVILATGGFEHDEDMVKNFIWTAPVKFYANPGNDGSGIKMAQEVGADLWHMSLIGGRFIPYFPELGYGLQNGSNNPFVFVDKYGKRFIRESWKNHSACYEGFRFSTDLCDFPYTPCFQVFDQAAVDKGPVVRGGMLKVGAYEWSEDNSAEIQKGWILKGDTIEDLAKVIARDPDVGNKMDPAVLAKTITTYNGYCETGVDPDFNRTKSGLVALNKPPFYALKMYPGGVNTFGGPKRNAKSQIVHPDGTPVGHLYGVGEMGSVQGFLYSGGGWNICEIAVSAQLASENAVAETPLS